MSDLKICRICLQTSAKMYKSKEFKLRSYYEEIMNLKVTERDALPQRFCYECAALLYKFHKFKEKCYNGHRILKDSLCKGAITYETIKSIDRQCNRLQSQFSVITLSNNVKMYRVKYKEFVAKHKIHEVVIPHIENIDVDNQSEASIKNDDIAHDSDFETNLKDNDITVDDKHVIKAFTENAIPHKEDVFNVDKSSSDNELVIDLGADNDTQIINKENSIKITLEDEKLSSDDEKTLSDLKKTCLNTRHDDKVDIVCNSEEKQRNSIRKRDCKKRKNKRPEPETNRNKFKLETKRGKYLNSNNWLKIYLSEEEAEREFKARGEDRKYLKAPFKCTDCFKGFSQQDMLDRHIKLRHAETLGPIECRFCRMRFKWKCYLTKHMPRHYIIYKCLRCNLVCRMETSAIFHEDYHNGVIRKCKHCGEEFKHLSTYYTHLRTHRSQHVCNLCGVSFVSEAGLHLHKLVKHVGAPATQDRGKTDTEGDTFCERCDIKFETSQAYEEHLFHSAMHSKGVEDLVEDIPASACPKVRRKGMRTPRKPTTCSYCGKIFPTQSACMKHHHADHARTPFCPTDERHICEICGLSLAPVSVAHHLNTHTRERLFSCNTCGVQFNTKSSMNRHQLTHTGEKPFACSLCDKRFTQSNSVKLHYRTFHLKQPYPKRNRKKKTDEVMLAEDFRTEESESLTLDRWR